jgi:hypothetical protein
MVGLTDDVKHEQRENTKGQTVTSHGKKILTHANHAYCTYMSYTSQAVESRVQSRVTEVEPSVDSTSELMTEFGGHNSGMNSGLNVPSFLTCVQSKIETVSRNRSLGVRLLENGG